MFVADVAAAVVTCLFHEGLAGGFHAFNVCTGTPTSVKSLAELVSFFFVCVPSPLFHRAFACSLVHFLFWCTLGGLTHTTLALSDPPPPLVGNSRNVGTHRRLLLCLA